MKKIYVLYIGLIGLMLLLSAGFVMAQKDQTQDLNRAVIKIDTLSCGGCFSTINAGLETLDGYSGLGANLFRKLIAVDFTAPLTKELIAKKLEEVGYPGEIKYVDAIVEKESFAYLESKRTGFSGAGGGGCCSSGSGPPQNKSVQGQNSQVLPSGGSCCTVPGGNTNIKGESL